MENAGGNDWRSRLESGGIVLLDGGTGSELRRRGVPLDRRVWSAAAALTHPEALTGVHADYIAAGADVVTTNTFATHRFVLDEAGLGDRFDAINRATVEAAQRARDQSGRNVAIAGSLSCLPPAFDVARYPAAQAERAAYVELASLLAELGVDLLVLEMLEDTRHARLVCEAARETGLPFWIGVSPRLAADRASLVAYDFPDVAFADVLDAVLGFDPAVVNVMHCPVEAVEPALAAVAARRRGPIGAYPEVIAEPEPRGLAAPGPRELAALAGGWIEMGAHVLGGCCGTTPEHVRALKSSLAYS